MDQTSKSKNVKDTLYEWAIQSKILNKAFGTTDSKEEIDEIHSLLQKLFSEENKDVVKAKLYKKLWGSRCQFGPLPPFELLQEFEKDGVYHKDYRDHTTHSLFTCFLGLYIYENNSTIKDSFSDFIEKNFSTKKKDEQEEIFVSLWLLSSLYHDIGYLVENKKIEDKKSDAFKRFKEKIDGLLCTPLANTLSFSEQISTSIESQFINDSCIAHKNLNSIDDIEINFDLLKSASDYSGLTRKDQDINGIKQYYDFAASHQTLNGRPSFRDHGISSALLLLYIWTSFREYIANLCLKNYDKYYSYCWEKIQSLNNKLKEEISEHIIIAAAQAISLHNIIKKSLWDEEETLSKSLTLSSFRIMLKGGDTAMPLAFLLRLCDELQVWDRPRFRLLSENDNDLTSQDISIIALNDTISLRFFKDEDLLINPDGKHSWYYKLHEVLQPYFNPEEFNALLTYETYHIVSDGSGKFLRLFRDEIQHNTDKNSQNYNLILLGNLLSKGHYETFPKSKTKITKEEPVPIDLASLLDENLNLKNILGLKHEKRNQKQ